MPSPRKSWPQSFKVDTVLSPSQQKDLDDALMDWKPESQTTQKRQSVAFDTESLSPSSKSKLQKAWTEENAWTDPMDSTAKKAWVDAKLEDLYGAFAKGRKAESSTCGYSDSADKLSAKEGTTQDLRYTLTQTLEKYGPIVLMYKGHDALGRHWISGWKPKSEQMAVVMCVEEEAKRKSSTSTASSSGSQE